MKRRRRAKRTLAKWRYVLGASGRYAPWFGPLRGAHGVYMFRDTETHEILYVGESHSGQLADTIQRHFQKWRGTTAGTTYPREFTECRVMVTRTGPRARRLQDDWIVKYQPRDNVQGQPKDDEHELAPDSTPF